MAGNKFLTNNAGVITEVASTNSSSGVSDANKVVSLNASGVLDSTIVNSKTTSAGAGDSGKVVALDGTGRIDSTMMPVGIGADTAIIVASEALSAGNLVNIYNNTGVTNVRKADNTTAGKEAHGFVLAAVSNGASATVYFEGTVTGLTGLTGGVKYLGTGGASAASAPSTAGNVAQIVGFATSASTLNFQSGTPIVLA